MPAENNKRACHSKRQKRNIEKKNEKQKIQEKSINDSKHLYFCFFQQENFYFVRKHKFWTI